ncbi:MAG: hypothetical protein HY301_16630 [Verrucomicrobia bacterium]|nr:hypothetical protein [Verrucomicrobiota bacterium]
MPPLHAASLAALLLCLFSFVSIAAEKNSAPEKKSTPAAGIPIATVKRGTVDFDRDVLPILKASCLACHNKTSAKADLNLETPATILKGGENGRAVKPKHGAESLLILAASHQADPPMPPKDNKANAPDLTPEQLGIIRLWIDQGAKASTLAAKPIEWQPLPPGLNPIYAVALTGDGQFAACGRANQIFIYHLPSGQLATRLTDAALLKSGLYAQPGVAHRDLVQSLAFSPDGTRLASGSYREVKLWRRPQNVQTMNLKNVAPKSATALATSADCKWLATGGDDGAVKLWSLPSGKPAKTFTGLRGAVSSVKFSHDGAKLAAAASDKTLAVWTVADGKVFAQATNTPVIHALAWLDDGKQFAAGCADNLIRLWKLPDATKGELVSTKELKGHTGAVTALDSTPAATNQLLSGSADGSMRAWDVAKGESVREFKHGVAVTAVAMRGDKKRFAAAGGTNVVKLWDAEGKVVAELKGNRFANELVAGRERGLTLATNEVVFRKDGLKSAETNLTALVERVKKAGETNDAAFKSFGEKEKGFKEASDAKAAAEKTIEEFAPVKRAQEALEAADKAAKQAEADAQAAKEKPDKVAAEKLAADAVAKTKAATEAKALADNLSAETKDKRKPAEDKLAEAVKKFEEAEKAFKKAETAKAQTEHELQLASAAKAKADQSVADAKAALASAESGFKQAEGDLAAARQAATNEEKPIRALAFSPDNLTLATAGDDQLIHAWSAETGAAFDVLKGQAGAVSAITFAGAERVASIASDRTAVVWEIKPAWTLERTLGSGDASSPLVDRVNAVRFSPDGKWLATGGGDPSRSGELKLWEVATGKLAKTFTNIHSDAVFALDFSRDGKFLASGAADKFARVTDLATGKVVKSFEGHTHHVLGVSLRADGRTLATAGGDNVVKIWDVPTGDRKKNIEGQSKEATSVQFIGVGDQALVSSGDRRVRIVRAQGDEVRAFEGPKDFVYGSAATADGAVVIAGGAEGVLHVFNGTNGQTLRAYSETAR